jgi:hypothetical protein
MAQSGINIGADVLPSLFKILGIDSGEYDDPSLGKTDKTASPADSGQPTPAQSKSVPTKLSRLQEIVGASHGSNPHPTMTDQFNSPSGSSPASPGGPPSTQRGPGVLARIPKAQQPDSADASGGFPMGAEQTDVQPQPLNVGTGDMPASLTQANGGRPQLQKTWAQEHPGLGAEYSRLGWAQGNGAAGAGAGSMTFGEGYQKARMLPAQIAEQKLGLQQGQATLAQTQARTAEIKSHAEDVPITYTGADGVTRTAYIPRDKVGTGALAAIIRGGTPKPLTSAFELWHQQNPNAPVSDFLKLQQDNKPDTGLQDKQRGRDLENQLRSGTLTDAGRDELTGRQMEAKIQGVPSEVLAQVGKPPVPAQFAKGESDPGYKAANRAWGTAVEAIKMKEASASGAARGEGFGAGRRMAVIDPRDGQVKIMSAGAAESLGAAPAGEGIKLMSKEAQFSELHVAAEKAKSAITGLDRDFTPTQIAKLTLAFSHDDAGVVKNEVDSILGTQQLTPAQQDFVIWINQLNERAMSLRNIAGMGQGSQDLRSAIRATLPGLKSGSKPMAFETIGRL